MSSSDETPDPPEQAEDLSLDAALGDSMFEDILRRFIEPEVQRRQAAGEWDDAEGIRLFQVLWRGDEGETEVRLNSEVKGSFLAKATRAIEKGEDVTHDDFDGVSEYTLPEDLAGSSHVTALSHRGGWGLAFDLNARHPRRNEFLDTGSEFAVTAREAWAAGRERAWRENAYAATELFAKAELLSHGPSIEYVKNSKSHKGVRTPYNLWGALKNTDQRFVRMLNRLGDLRNNSRYLAGPVSMKPGEDQEMADLLVEMEEHVTAVVEGRNKDPINVYATRDLKAGELVEPSASTIKPPSSS